MIIKIAILWLFIFVTGCSVSTEQAPPLKKMAQRSAAEIQPLPVGSYDSSSKYGQNESEVAIGEDNTAEMTVAHMKGTRKSAKKNSNVSTVQKIFFSKAEPTDISPPPAGLQEGRVAWNTPPAMNMGQSYPVEVRVTLDQAEFAGIASRVVAAGTTTTERAELSHDLIATLHGTKFDISPQEEQHQPVLSGQDTVWKWIISPKEPGKQALLLTIQSVTKDGHIYTSLTREILVNALPAPAPHPPPTFLDKTITFILGNWDKLLTLILIPLGGWAYRAYLKRRT